MGIKDAQYPAGANPFLPLLAMHVCLVYILHCLCGFSLLPLTPEVLYLGTPVDATGSSAHTLTGGFLFSPCTCHVFCWFYLNTGELPVQVLPYTLPCNPPQLLEQNHSCAGGERVLQTLTAGCTVYTKDQDLNTSPGGSMCTCRTIALPIFIRKFTLDD